MRVWSSAAMPTPVSVTEMDTSAFVRFPATVIVPPLGLHH
jgi:hypothetical protein